MKTSVKGIIFVLLCILFAFTSCKQKYGKRHTGPVFALAFSPDGKLIASGGAEGSDSTIRLWDAHTGENLKVFDELEGYVYAVSFSPDGKTLAAAGCGRTESWDGGICRQGRIVLIDWRTGEITRDYNLDDRRIFRSMSYNPDGSVIIAISYEKIYYFNVREGGVIRTVTGRTDYFSPETYSERFIATSGCVDSRECLFTTIDIRDAKTGRLLRTIKGKKIDQKLGNAHASLSLSRDGKVVASGEARHVDSSTYRGEIRLLDTETGKLLREIPVDGDAAGALAFNPDGTLLVSGKGDYMSDGAGKNVHIWDVRTGKLLRVLTGHKDGIIIMAFSPDGKILASADGAGEVKFWDIKSILKN